MWVLDVDVGVLLVLLFEGEWFLLLRVVVFISFPWAGLPGPCCDAAFASSNAVAFLLPSFSLCVACLLSLGALALLSSPSLFRIVGRRLPSLLVLFGWLARLAPSFSFLYALGYSSVIGYSLCLFLMVYR